MKKKNRSIRFRSASLDSSQKASGGTPQSNTPIVGLSKDRQWYDYMSDNSLTHFPEKKDWRNRIIFSLYEWFDNPDSIEIMQFCIEYKIKYTTLQTWRNKFPEIQEAWNDVKRMIACRRKVGAMKKNLDGVYAYRDMHLYDPEWVEVNKYHNDLKKDVAVSAAANAGIIANDWKKIMDGESEK